ISGESSPLTGSSSIEQTFIMRSVGPDDPGRTNVSLPSVSAPPQEAGPPVPPAHAADNGSQAAGEGFILGEISSPNLSLESPPPRVASESEPVPSLFLSDNEPQLPPTIISPLPPPPPAVLPPNGAVVDTSAQGSWPPPPPVTPTPPSGVPLPPEVAATPFRPIEPPTGAPRPMGRGQVSEFPVPPPKPPTDLFAQAASPVAPASRPKSRLALVIGLSIAAIVLVVGAVAVVAYFQFSAPPAPTASEPPSPETTPPDGITQPSAGKPPKPAIPENMVAIPGGEYDIGRDAGDFLDRYEKPRHTVTLRPFFIDKTEVTNADYLKFVEATGHPAPTSWNNGRLEPGKELFPVTGVTLTDAEAYAKWAGKRLPTEEEWEAAAHGRTPTVFPWGNAFDPSRANVKASGFGAPARVGSYPAGASPFGILDMTGNVWEWTASEAKLYPSSSEPPPTWNQPLNPGTRLQIIRGGAFTEETKRCTVTYRNWVPSNFSARELGFRCVLDQPPQ
ncbi:MAG: formylglycine-generating enzyme family protein, partial [Chloracidobacterium sp.]